MIVLFQLKENGLHKIEEKISGTKEVLLFLPGRRFRWQQSELKIQQPVSLVVLRTDSTNQKC